MRRDPTATFSKNEKKIFNRIKKFNKLLAFLGMNQHIIIDFEGKREQKMIKTHICPPRWACFGGKFATLAVGMTEFFQGGKFDLGIHEPGANLICTPALEMPLMNRKKLEVFIDQKSFI